MTGTKTDKPSGRVDANSGKSGAKPGQGSQANQARQTSETGARKGD